MFVKKMVFKNIRKERCFNNGFFGFNHCNI